LAKWPAIIKASGAKVDWNYEIDNEATSQ
jgi:hypothetical protein